MLRPSLYTLVLVCTLPLLANSSLNPLISSSLQQQSTTSTIPLGSSSLETVNGVNIVDAADSEKSSASNSATGVEDVNAGASIPWIVTRVDETDEIVIDGRIDERIWHDLPVHSSFYVVDPDTREPAPEKTEIRMFYNNKGLYVAAVMEQDLDTLVARLSARDQGFINRDYFSFVLDTSGEGRYGFWFQLNLGNSRSDGTVRPERNFNDNWDGAWYGKTSRTESGWSAEYFVPWSLVAMPNGDNDRTMGIFFSRQVAHADRRLAWPVLPFSEPKFMSSLQTLTFTDVRPRQQLSFFPSVSSSFDSVNSSSSGNLSGDLFWRPSTNFQLTASLRPDFGTVEADSVIINLSAIETFFPEKRLFFLEGQEIFSNSASSSGGGSSPSLLMLHTRRIGQRPIFPDIPEGADFDGSDFRQPSDLLGAIKAAAQAGPLRIGVLGAWEDDTTFRGTLNDEPVGVTQAGREFGVARLLWEKSEGFYRGFGFMSTRMSHPSGDARTHGFDARYFNGSGNLNVVSQFVMSDVDGERNGFGGYVGVTYFPRQGLSHNFVVESFDSALNLSHVGYLPRNDTNAVGYQFRWRSFPETWIREASTRVSVNRRWNSANETTSAEVDVRQEFTFANLYKFRLSAEYSPTTYDDQNSFGNGTFEINPKKEISWRLITNSSKRVYLYVAGEWEDEDIEGSSYRSSAFLVWRTSDRFNVSTSLGYRNREGWLLYRGDNRFIAYESENWSPKLRMDYFLSSSQHIAFDLEWHGIRAGENRFYELRGNDPTLFRTGDPNPDALEDFGISVLNMQLRYRWEIAPLSDLFVVYTKNAELPSTAGKSFVDQFSSTFDHPVSEAVSIKLRHRWGI